jgi:ankyrin repeat protein
MTYMAFDNFNQEVNTLEEKILDRYPLLQYAAVRWDYHLRSSKTRNSAVEDMAVTLVIEKYTSQLASKIFLTSRLQDCDNFNLRPEKQLSNFLDQQSSNPESTTESFPLHIAASTGSPELFRRVSDSVKVDINAKDAWGNCLLTLAAVAGHQSLVKLILDPPYNANVNVETEDCLTALLLAAWKGYTEIVKMLLEKDDVDVNKANSRGSTPLAYAARWGHSEIVKLLLEKDGVDVNKATSQGSTPLSLATGSGHTEIVKLLLEKDGVDMNKAGDDGDTPLLLAAWTGYTEVVKMLLQKDGVDVNKADSRGSTPLLLAARGGHTEVVKMLIEHGATVDTRENGGRTPLSLAAQYHRLESLNILLKSSADLNTKDETHGRTPLMWSFYDPEPWEKRKEYRNFDILKALLSEQDINVNWKAKDGSTALSRAIECELHEVEELLRAHGAV